MREPTFPILSKILEKIQSLCPATVLLSGTASQKNCFFLLKLRKSGARETKNVKAILFLTFNEFKKTLNSEKLAGYRLKTGVINTIKGNYFYASVKDQ